MFRFQDSFQLIAKEILDNLHNNQDLYCCKETTIFFKKCLKVNDKEIISTILQIINIQLKGQAKYLYFDMCTKKYFQTFLCSLIQSSSKQNAMVALKITLELVK